MKRFWIGILCLILCSQSISVLGAEEKKTEISVTSPSALLMEVSTGQVLYEKEADEKRAPASVTKVMTMLLIFDALKEGKISLEEEVTVSEYAASMGGSQVFLEPGETQSVETLLKCISVASANDACVAMAEHISGSEEAFVSAMNERAKKLKMTNTTFVNCNGLDAEGHVTTARDIARMSRELLTRYPEIHTYATIWMENITHKTRKGTSEFGLTNTNKLIRQYPYATGLKTGSTGNAGFCVSASAKKEEVELLAVIMGAEDSKSRFQDATTLLNYGFGICARYEDREGISLPKMPVAGGMKDSLSLDAEECFTYMDTKGRNFGKIEKKLVLPEQVKAPVKKGEQIGAVEYYLENEKLGERKVLAGEDVERRDFSASMKKILPIFLLSNR